MSQNSLDSLVGGLTNAATAAREMLEKQHIKTLNSFFERKKDALYPKMVKVMMPTLNGNNDKAMEAYDIPYFSLVPPNSLKISELEIEFDTFLSEVKEKNGKDASLQMDVKGKGALGKEQSNCKVRIKIVSDQSPEGWMKINNQTVKLIP